MVTYHLKEDLTSTASRVSMIATNLSDNISEEVSIFISISIQVIVTICGFHVSASHTGKFSKAFETRM